MFFSLTQNKLSVVGTHNDIAFFSRTHNNHVFIEQKPIEKKLFFSRTQNNTSFFSNTK